MFTFASASRLRSLLLLTSFGLALGACKKDEDDPKPTTPTGCASYQTVTVSGDITTPTTWTGCTIYVVNRTTSVKAVLTIEPGAIVKFASSAGLRLDGAGRIAAAGRADAPVVFTSLLDDARGGDTNADGAATTPAPKDWYNVAMNGVSGSSFAYCEFRYGGGGSSNNSTLDLWNAATTVDHCVFADNAGGAPQFNGALDASHAPASTVVKNSSFYRNRMPLHVSVNFSLDESNTFVNPQNAAEKNQFQGIWATKNNATDRVADWTWEETELPFVTDGFDFAQGTLKLGAGVTVKFKPAGYLQLHDGAMIVARGTADKPVTFTSLTDDATGGDTNANGTSTTPAKRDWNYINIDGENGSVFEYCRFLYGGGGTHGTTLEAGSNGALTVKHSTFAHNGFDVSVATYATLNASTAGNGTVLQDNTFFDNYRPLAISAAFSLDGSNVFHDPANPAVKNQYQGIFIDWDNNVVAPTLSWGETEAAYVVVAHGLDLATGKSLTLANDVTVKFYPGLEMIFRDSDAQLVNHGGAYFSSFKDDSRGGDSNGDGATTLPADGDWRGVYTDDVPGIWHTWANIKYDSN